MALARVPCRCMRAQVVPRVDVRVSAGKRGTGRPPRAPRNDGEPPRPENKDNMEDAELQDSSTATPPALDKVALTRMTVDLDARPKPSSSHEVEELKKVDPKPALRQESRVDELRQAVLSCTAGLDRGLSATRTQAQRVEEVATRLEQSRPPVSLTWLAAGKARAGLEEFAGVWRLVYSSAFLKGNLGGSRPGPPAALVPFSLGPVYQRIESNKAELDNIVELVLPALPLLAEPPRLRLSLQHSFQVLGDSKVDIVYESTRAELLNGECGPAISESVAQLNGFKLKFSPPSLQQMLPKSLRSATFEVTFLDNYLRVTRGDRGELRIYIRDPSALGDIAYPDPDTNNTYSMDS